MRGPNPSNPPQPIMTAPNAAAPIQPTEVVLYGFGTPFVVPQGAPSPNLGVTPASAGPQNPETRASRGRRMPFCDKAAPKLATRPPAG